MLDLTSFIGRMKKAEEKVGRVNEARLGRILEVAISDNIDSMRYYLGATTNVSDDPDIIEAPWEVVPEKLLAHRLLWETPRLMALRALPPLLCDNMQNNHIISLTLV